MLPTAIVTDVVDLSVLDVLLEAELAYQRTIAKARAYHGGEQAVYLTDRLRAFLGIGLESDSRFNLNICRTVVEAVTERLLVQAFDSEDKALVEWAQAVWRQNKMDAKADDTHEMAVRDGEAFVIVDWDEAAGRPRLTPHPRYVAVEAGGDGFGFLMIYPDEDTSLPPRYAIKRWVETLPSGYTRARATYYFPDRIEKYAYNGGWMPVQDDGDEGWPLPWVDAASEPLGIPVTHFLNKGQRPEAWDAIPAQDGINKTFLDLMASADLTAFQIYVAIGWIPTIDGKELKEDGSNALTIEPGQLIGTTKKQTDASFQAVQGADLTPLVNMLQKLILFAAMVTNTPIARFQITGMVSAEQSQKQADAPLITKVNKKQAVFGDAWEAVMDTARRVALAFGAEPLNEDAELTLLWKPAEARSQEEFAAEMKLKKELGVPRRQLWSELGYEEAKIDEMMAEPEVRNFTGVDFP